MNTPSASMVTRQQVWYSLLDAAHQARYFSELAERALRRHKKRVIAHACVASGVLTAFFEVVPSWVSIGIYALVVLFSLHSLVIDYSLDFATVRMVSNRCRELEVKFRGLWLEVENNRREPLYLEGRWYELAQDLDRAKDAVGSIAMDDDLSVYTAREAARTIQEELA